MCASYLVLVGLTYFNAETGNFNWRPVLSSMTLRMVSSQFKIHGNRKSVAHICITGVWEDLELHSKLKHLIHPFRARGDFHQIFVSLLLQRGGEGGLFPPYRNPLSPQNSSRHVEGVYYRDPNDLETGVDLAVYLDPLGNVDSFGNTTISQAAEQRLISLEAGGHGKQQFRSLAEASDFLLSNNVSIGTLEVYSPLINPPINAEYVIQLAIAGAFVRNSQNERVLRKEGLRRTIWRAVNDVRTIEAYDRCWSAVRGTMSQHNDGDTIVILVGDDAVLKEEQNLTALLNENRQKSEVTTLLCNTARGHTDDQIQLIPSLTVAKSYLTLPYKWFYQKAMFNEQVTSMASYLRLISNIVQSRTQNEHQQVGTSISYPNQHKDTTKIKGSEISLIEDYEVKRAFVCITGQLMRLELENKMKNLIGPLLDGGYEVDVALVLAQGNASFQSHKKPKNVSAVPFADEASVWRWLSNYNASIVSKHITYPADSNIPVNPQYWLQKGSLVDQIHENFLADYTQQQVIANFRMVESYTRCWHDVVASGKTYSLFVRARDDVGFSSPINTSLLHQELGSKPRVMVTSAFRTNGGINDRLAFVSYDSASCYFNIPFVKFFDGSNLDVAMRNSESYFKRVYWHTNCAEIQTTSGINPLKIFNGQTVR